MYEPGMAGKIVNACAVLHNMRIAHGIRDEDVQQIDDAVCRPNVVHPEDRQLQGRALAVRIQERFIARQYGRL